GDFVSDHRADGAVVVSVVAIGVVERRLQDTRGENDFVELRVVVSVDGRRRHAPFAAVDGFADFREVARVFKFRGAKNIPGVRAAIGSQRGIIAPRVRVADFYGEGFQFFDGGLAGGRAHPRQALQIVAEGRK